MRSKPWKADRDPIDWDEAFRLRERENWTFAEIAEEFGYSPKTVRVRLLAMGAHGQQRARQDRSARKLREVWRFTHEKCEKPSHPSYALNGGEGVTVSPAWREFEPFYEWARASGFRQGLRLARISEFGPYAPWNCRWVTVADRMTTRRLPTGRTRLGQKQRPIDWEAAMRLYLEEGLSMPQVAKRVGASYTGIYFGFKRLGVSRPKLVAPTSTPEGRRLHKTWLSLHKRCTDPNNRLYPYHGARGATVTREWRTFGPFLRWATKSGAKPGLCLLRIDRSKPYAPGNCRWGTRREATLQRRPPSHAPSARRPITAFGETQSLADWSRDRRCVVSLPTIRDRLDKGWTAAEAIATERENKGGADRVVVELRAFGQTKSVASWLRDKRCRVTSAGLADRLRRGWSAETAIATPPFREPARRPRRNPNVRA